MLYDRAKTCSRDFPKKLTNVNTVPWNTDTVFSLTENCPSGIFFCTSFSKPLFLLGNLRKVKLTVSGATTSLPWMGRWKPRELLVRTRACHVWVYWFLLGKKNNKLNFSLFLSVGIRKTKCCARLQIWTCAWDPWVIFAEMCWKMAPGILKLQAMKGSFWIYQDIYFFRGPKPFIRCAKTWTFTSWFYHLLLNYTARTCLKDCWVWMCLFPHLSDIDALLMESKAR